MLYYSYTSAVAVATAYIYSGSKTAVTADAR